MASKRGAASGINFCSSCFAARSAPLAAAMTFFSLRRDPNVIFVPPLVTPSIGRDGEAEVQPKSSSLSSSISLTCSAVTKAGN